MVSGHPGFVEPCIVDLADDKNKRQRLCNVRGHFVTVCVEFLLSMQKLKVRR